MLFTPRDVYDLWDHVRQDHWYMLDARTLSALRTFSMTYSAALLHHGIELPAGEPNFNHFGGWVAARYGDPLSSRGWQHFIATSHGDVDGYVEFFRLVDEFRTRVLVELASTPVPDVRWPHRRTTTLPSGERRDEVIHPITRVRLLGYLPEDVCWAELTRTEGEPELHWVGNLGHALEWCRRNLGVAVG